MKKIITLVIVLAVVLTAMAQSKLTPQAQLKVKKIQDACAVTVGKESQVAPTKTPGKHRQGAFSPRRGAQGEALVRLVVKVSPAAKAHSLAKIKELGAQIEGVLGDQLAISLPVDNVAQLSQLDGVVRIDAPRKPRLKTDKSREATGVSLLNGPTATSSVPLTGAGVTVCIIDGGIDFQHPAFKNADGSTRIKAVYSMVNENGREYTCETTIPELGPVSYTLPGSVFDTPELIATLTTDAAFEDHGTHTSSTAAGSMSPQGFCGMAPEADIVLVPFGLFGAGEGEDDDDDDDSSLIPVFDFLKSYVQQSGKPLVLSASLGSHGGPHDGTSAMCEALDDISNYVIPVFSAGNEGAETNYIGFEFTATEPTMSTILAGLGQDLLDPDVLNAEAEVYGFIYNVADDGQAALRLSLIDPNGTEVLKWQSPMLSVGPNDEPQTIFLSSDDDDELGEVYEGDINISIGSQEEGRIDFYVNYEGDIQGQYLPVLTVVAPEGAELNMWDEQNSFEGGGAFVEGTSDCSASDWSSTESVISVGAYCANTICRSLSDNTYDINDQLSPGSDPVPEGCIAPFSSYGVMPNSVVQPTICAPGMNIVAAVNHYNHTLTNLYSPDMLWQGFPYAPEEGTSMACPTVAGIVALWLQACPTLTVSDIRDVLLHSSDNDSNTATTPVRWGYGKINAKAGFDYILENYATGISDLKSQAQKAQAPAIYDLQGRRVARPVRGLYIVNGQKVVVR